MKPDPTSMGKSSKKPVRVRTALEVLAYLNAYEHPDTWGEDEDVVVTLDDDQKRLKKTAIKCLVDYLSGEVDFGDAPYVRDNLAEDSRQD